ncbi:MAG: hypothetical protein F6K40_19040 [Okeania sp. SIO3I5]|uniref:hypothetical protein n=1 Tax=Okeania sp. SIO3I5 TaxID=2607805 RepID=UPI0013B6B82C|nr:hypothetical protein [Okeania sp. SIO3I5]NEQ38244.1 hypothetical protein [Okeania sp. SIO3I5]
MAISPSVINSRKIFHHTQSRSASENVVTISPYAIVGKNSHHTQNLGASGNVVTISPSLINSRQKFSPHSESGCFRKCCDYFSILNK